MLHIFYQSVLASVIFFMDIYIFWGTSIGASSTNKLNKATSWVNVSVYVYVCVCVCVCVSDSALGNSLEPIEVVVGAAHIVKHHG